MLGIIAAMEAEVKELLIFMEDVTSTEISHTRFFIGKLQGKDAVLMQSGVGKGSAAISTTILLEHFCVSHIVNIGTAGGLLPQENILDIVISSDIVQHDYDTSGIDGKAGIGLYFQSDEKLRRLCVSVLKQLQKPYHIGLIASGDQFIHEEEQLKRLSHSFPEAICAEMEAGAIAQVCSLYRVPFIVLRSLSDIAHKDESYMDYQEYVRYASKASAVICEQIAKHM